MVVKERLVQEANSEGKIMLKERKPYHSKASAQSLAHSRCSINVHFIPWQGQNFKLSWLTHPSLDWSLVVQEKGYKQTTNVFLLQVWQPKSLYTVVSNSKPELPGQPS